MKCPTGKIVFTTRISAWSEAIKKGNKYNHKLVPYHCPICKRIHLTKREDTVKGSVIPHRVGARINIETGEKIKKFKKQNKNYGKIYTMPKPKKPSLLQETPEWKKKILRFIIKLLRI